MTRLSTFGFLILFTNVVYSQTYNIWKRHATPFVASKGWVKQEEAKSNSLVLVHIALRQSNENLGVSSLLDISNPTSPQYGKYWEASEVAKTFNPSSEVISSVVDWLNRSGVHLSQVSGSHSGGFLNFNLTVHDARRLLNTTFYQLMNEDDDRGITCYDYRIPHSVSSSVEYITAFSLYRQPKRAKREAFLRRRRRLYKQDFSAATVDCDKYTAPVCLRDIYNIPGTTQPHPNNTFGIYESAWETWLADDLDLFFSIFQPELVNQRPVVESIDGGYMQTDIKITPFNLEPDLDFEYAIALTSPQTITNVQVGDEFQLGKINNMLAAFDSYYCGMLDLDIDPTFPDPRPGGYNQSTDCGTQRPPNVLSISYGESEANFPKEYLQRQCFEFLKLGLMGVTVVVGSGDDGPASGLEPGTCIDPETGVSNVTSGKFSPVWPAACPWVTTVGGTQRIAQTANFSIRSLTRKPPKAGRQATLGTSSMNNTSTVETSFNTVIGSRILSSGGGFSNVFPIPPYQLAAVTEYQLREDEHLKGLSGVYNRAGRGIPDISALASAYLTAVDGTIHTVYGTSASAPVVASILTMINNERLNLGKGPVGFINPVLYSHSYMLNDVTTGYNEGCGYSPAFRASSSWDAVTGLGTPDYARMAKVFVSLP